MTPAVPRILHQMWIGSPLPIEIAAMMVTWKTHHPDWQIHLWADPGGLRNQDLYDRGEEITPDAPEQFRSDVARYEILHRFGGVWADADFVCQKPIDDLLGSKPFAVREGRWLNNAIIGSPRRHPMLEDLISLLPQSVARQRPEHGNTVKSGPQFFTPIARRWKITELAQETFFPYLWNELDRGTEEFPDAYAVHHWQNQRRRQGQPLATR